MLFPLVTRFGADPLLARELATKNYVDTKAGQTFARVVKLADQIVNNSTTLVNDTEIFIPLEANKTYAWIIWIYVITTNTADIKETYTVPAGASGGWCETIGANVTRNNYGVTEFQGMGNLLNKCNTQTGQVSVGATAGNLQFQFAQQAADVTDTTVQAGSCMVVWESV